MTSISNKLVYLNETKALIKDALKANAFDVNDATPFRDYADAIDSMSKPVKQNVWEYPSDWIDIRDTNDNEINILVTETVGISFDITVANGGTFSVDWGDGNVQHGLASGATCSHQHISQTGGQLCEYGYYTWKVRIYNATGNITKINFKKLTSYLECSPVLAVVFGTRYISSYEGQFYTGLSVPEFRIMKYVEFKGFETTTTLYNCFSNCASISTVIFPSTFGSLTTIQQVLNFCFVLTSVKMPESWGNVTDASNMFNSCKALTEIDLPDNWGVVSNISNLFYNCSSLSRVNFPKSDLTVQNISGLFYNCYSLRSFVFDFKFNGATNASSMFYNCSSLTKVRFDIDSFGTLTDVSLMFNGCKSLLSVILPISWGNVTNINAMFKSCAAVNYIKMPESWGNVNCLGNSLVFSGCGSLTEIEIPENWGNMTAVEYLFSGCGTLSKIKLPDSWGNVTSVSSMFSDCTSLSEVKIPSSWGNITSATNMFKNCYALKKITLPDSWGSVSNVSSMFSGCWSMVEANLPKSFGEITTAASMFINCKSLKKIDGSEFLGSNTQVCDFSAFSSNSWFLQYPLVIGSRLSKIEIIGASGGLLLLSSIRLTNALSTFTGTSPHVNVSYTSLDAAALNTLFGDLPVLTGKTINITGASGAATCNKTIATGKGWTVIG